MPRAAKTEKPAKATKSAKKTSGDKPKRAPSAYIVFCGEKRDQVKAENPDATFGEIGKILGAKWAALDDKGRAVSESRSS